MVMIDVVVLWSISANACSIKTIVPAWYYNKIRVDLQLNNGLLTPMPLDYLYES